MIVLPTPTEASRQARLPPLSLHTVHGGTLADTDGVVKRCVVGMRLPENYGGPSGVCYARHHYQLSFHNPSDETQTISLSLLEGTTAYGSNSNGAKSSGINFAGTGPILLRSGSDLPAGNIRLLAHTSVIVELEARCQSDGCIIIYIDRNKARKEVVSNGNKPPMGSGSCGTAKPQVCLAQKSFLVFRIAVAEDTGAITGMIATSAHRASGYEDFFLSPPMTSQINGGRPF